MAENLLDSRGLSFLKLAVWHHVIGLEKEENLQKTDIFCEGKEETQR